MIRGKVATSGKTTLAVGDSIPQERPMAKTASIPEVSLAFSSSDNITSDDCDKKMTKSDLEAGGVFESEAGKKPWDIPKDFAQVKRIYRKEAVKCTVMVLSYAFAVGHLYVYAEVFGVRICEKDLVPEDEKAFFHYGWVAMLVIFLIEAITVILKVWATSHSPLLATSVAQKFEGNIGVLFGEYIVVAATYIIMGYNMMPVFIELRTHRRVYGVRYMEWLVDACGLVYLDCKCLFNRSFLEFRVSFVWTVAYILLGLWSALATKWSLYWIFLVGSWLTFFVVCYMLVDFLRRDPRPRDPFGNAPIKKAILSFVIFWWILYGVLFMVAFQAPEIMPQWLEQLLWTGMDVVMKLSHTVVLMTWRATQWDIDSVVSHQKVETQRFIAELERVKATTERDRALLMQRQVKQQKMLPITKSLDSDDSSSPMHRASDSQRSLDGSESTHSNFGFVAHCRRRNKRAMTSKRPKVETNWTATPGLHLEVPTMVRLSDEVGEGVVTQRHRKGMMSPEDFAEMQRLEQLGSLHADLESQFQWQMREQFFLLNGMHHTAYNPDSWTETLIAWRGRARASHPCWIVIIVAFVVNLLAELAPEMAQSLRLSGKVHSLIGGSIMFLVVFRTQYAFRKWWEGRVVFGRIVVLSRVLAQRICAYVLDDQLCHEMVRYVIVAAVATKCHLRHKRVEPVMLSGVLTDKELEALNMEPHMPFHATSTVVKCLARAVQGGNLVGPLAMAIDNAIRAFDEAIGEAERLLTPMPFVYVAHLRTFLFLYLLSLPFVLVAELGRMTTIAVAVASYLLIGLENTAVELENPFGMDANDLPLDHYCMEISRDLLKVLDARVVPGAAAPVAVKLQDKTPQGGDDDGGDGGGGGGE